MPQHIGISEKLYRLWFDEAAHSKRWQVSNGSKMEGTLPGHFYTTLKTSTAIIIHADLESIICMHISIITMVIWFRKEAIAESNRLLNGRKLKPTGFWSCKMSQPCVHVLYHLTCPDCTITAFLPNQNMSTNQRWFIISHKTT